MDAACAPLFLAASMRSCRRAGSCRPQGRARSGTPRRTSARGARRGRHRSKRPPRGCPSRGVCASRGRRSRLGWPPALFGRFATSSKPAGLQRPPRRVNRDRSVRAAAEAHRSVGAGHGHAAQERRRHRCRAAGAGVPGRIARATRDRWVGHARGSGRRGVAAVAEGGAVALGGPLPARQRRVVLCRRDSAGARVPGRGRRARHRRVDGAHGRCRRHRAASRRAAVCRPRAAGRARRAAVERRVDHLGGCRCPNTRSRWTDWGTPERGRLARQCRRTAWSWRSRRGWPSRWRCPRYRRATSRPGRGRRVALVHEKPMAEAPVQRRRCSESEVHPAVTAVVSDAAIEGQSVVARGSVAADEGTVGHVGAIGSGARVAHCGAERTRLPRSPASKWPCP